MFMTMCAARLAMDTSFSKKIFNFHLILAISQNKSATLHLSGCKDNHFYSLPFRQVEASIYYPRRHFN